MVADVGIRAVERDYRMAAGEVRAFYVEVTNTTGETWPGGMEDEPRVRVSYHLSSGSGELLRADGPRSPLPAPLAPGETQIVPVLVEAPTAPGRYVVAIDLVHEHVRWFESPLAIEVEVVGPGPRERNVPRLRRLPRRMRIPRRLHQVWVGSAPMPDEHRRFAAGWRERHPGWDYRLWTDDDFGELGITPDLVRQAVTPAELSNLIRYQVVAEHGGVYVDTDAECLRPIDELVRGLDAFAGCSIPGRVSAGLFGAVPGHPAVERCAALARRFAGLRYPESTCGPILFTEVLWDFPEFTVYPPEFFYPYLWDEPERRHDRFDGAYSVHHWTLSWRVEPPAPS